MIRAAVVALLVASVASAAPDDYLSRLPILVQQRLDEMAAARAPKLVPPTPTRVTWKAIRIGSLDAGAPLVAFTAADLDGDGKSELYAVTSREVVAISLKGKPTELGRVAFTGERAVPAPRDVVGSAVANGRELLATSSAWAKELRVTLAKTKLAATVGDAGFPVCANERMQLVPGRNYFAGDIAGVRCKSGLIDRAGAPLELRAQLDTSGRLVVEAKKCAANCTFEVSRSGTAFDLVDVDRDGVPEVVVSGYVAPGDPDGVKVIAVGSDERKPLFKKTFNGGVVGIAAVETTIIVAVRLAGSTRVDLWRLN